MDRILFHGEVFVQIKGDDIFKAQTFLLVKPNQYVVYLGGWNR